MKRKFLLIIVLLLCIGCTKIDNNYSDIIDSVIKNNSNIYNTTSLGYKYYLPMGVSRIYDKDFNQKFKVNDTYIYLYVDIVSYYYKNSINMDDSSESQDYFYTRIGSNDDVSGYVKIVKDDGKYFIKAVYNYAKIEAYVNEWDIDNILSYAMIILDSISYNDKLVESIILDEHYSSAFKEYKIKKPDNTESKFSEYLSEYVGEEEVRNPSLPEY